MRSDHSPLHAHPRFFLITVLLVTASAGFCSSIGGIGSTRMYLDVPGIPGESTAIGFEGQMQIESWSWGATNSGAADTPHSLLSDFVIVKELDKATPLLLEAHCAGAMIGVVTCTIITELAATPTRDASTKYLEITMMDCLISSYQMGGSSGADSVPIEQFSLNFEEIKVRYSKRGMDGGLLETEEATCVNTEREPQ